MAPSIGETLSIRRARDSIRSLNSTLPKKRIDLERYRMSVSQAQSFKPISIQGLDSLLDSLHITHGNLRSTAVNGRNSIVVSFSGSSSTLHQLWKGLNGWDVSDWSIRSDNGKILGTFKIIEIEDLP